MQHIKQLVLIFLTVANVIVNGSLAQSQRVGHRSNVVTGSLLKQSVDTDKKFPILIATRKNVGTDDLGPGPLLGVSLRNPKSVLQLADPRCYDCVQWASDHSCVLFGYDTYASGLSNDDFKLRKYSGSSDSFGPEVTSSEAFGGADVRIIDSFLSGVGWNSSKKLIAWPMRNEESSDVPIVITDLRNGRSRTILGVRLRRMKVDHIQKLAWSHNGTHLALVLSRNKGRASDSTSEIWVVSSDGSGLRKVGDGIDACWCNDDLHIVSIRGSINDVMARFDIRSGRTERLSTCSYESMCISPSGRYIAALGVGAKNTAKALDLLTANGQFVRHLASSGSLSNYYVMPNCLSW